jgi:hypothetical protein
VNPAWSSLSLDSKFTVKLPGGDCLQGPFGLELKAGGETVSYNLKIMQPRPHSLHYIVVILALSSAALAQTTDRSLVRMAVPGVEGALELNVGPTTWKSHVRSDGLETQMSAMDRPDNLLISAFLQHVTFPASAERCRAEWWPDTEKGNQVRFGELADVHQTAGDGMVKMEFIIPAVDAAKVRQKNVHAYMGSGNLCVEVHLSKILFEPKDQKLFDEVLASVRFLPGETVPQVADTAHDAMYFLEQGSRYYMKHDYPIAAQQYQKALDLEKKDRTLNKDLFRVLVDNLAISYGISGDLPKVKETVEYGITQDPQYPIFYYNLACMYGETGKIDESLEQLRLAYKYKANIIAGETFPDPLQDDSFRKFVNDTRFVKAVREMQKQ